MRMNLLYVHAQQIGYGRMGVELSAALRRAGVDICDDMPGEGQAFQIPADAKSGTCGHVGWLSTPGHCRGWWKGQDRSILTMWESSVLPEPFRESFDNFRVMVVPSEQNRELFSQYHPNVIYVPLGIDPTWWSPRERPGLDGTFFNFLICGGGKRKGVDLVVEAFAKTFPTWPKDRPIPRLIVKSPRVQETYGHDRIEVMGGYVGAAEERELYAMSHVYVQPSRGEGFGLQPLQAIAQGMVTIATDAHGHKAYSHLLTHPLSASMVETPPQSFHHGPAGSWWEPDFDELCAAMEDAYYRYEAHLPIARQFGLRATDELTWDRTAAGYIEAIGRDALSLPDVDRSEWIKPTQRRYGVRVTEPHIFEVGGLQYQMVPGRTYYEPADVKRILFDANMLDPSCLGVDEGLLPHQVEQIPDYTASKALCHACGQHLNTNRPDPEWTLANVPVAL